MWEHRNAWRNWTKDCARNGHDRTNRIGRSCSSDNNAGMTTNLNTLARDYERVACAIRYLERNAEDQPELEHIAAHVGLSSAHFQRLFSRWAGISPKRFLQYLTLRHTRQILRESNQSLLDTTHQAGLSSVSRLHDLYLHCEAMTPAEYRTLGAGLTVSYGVHPTPFGHCLIGLTERGLCNLQFIDDGEEQALGMISRNWPNATLRSDVKRTRELSERLFCPLRHPEKPLYAMVRGTPFQLKVWEALLQIPLGQIVSYQAVARSIQRPQSARAVANAIANNPLHFLIPCHRVIQSSGNPGGYRAGSVRKKALLGWEAAKRERDADLRAHGFRATA